MTAAYRALLLNSALVLVLSPAQALPAKAPAQAWKLEQFDQSLGKTVSFAAPGVGQSLTSLSNTYKMTISPPDWNIYLLNPQQKQYFICSHGNNVKTVHGFKMLKAIATRLTEDTWQWKLKKTVLFKGVKTDIWEATKQQADKNSPGKIIDSFQLWMTPEIPVPQPIVVFHERCYGWPLFAKGFPLRYMSFRENKLTNTILETSTIEKIPPPPPSQFKVPKDFKESQNEMEVFTNASGIKDILEEWTTDLPRKK